MKEKYIEAALKAGLEPTKLLVDVIETITEGTHVEKMRLLHSFVSKGLSSTPDTEPELVFFAATLIGKLATNDFSALITPLELPSKSKLNSLEQIKKDCQFILDIHFLGDTNQANSLNSALKLLATKSPHYNSKLDSLTTQYGQTLVRLSKYFDGLDVPHDMSGYQKAEFWSSTARLLCRERDPLVPD